MSHSGRLVIVSNRLPVVLSKNNNQLKTSVGSGGLVSALAPALKNRGGVWIGWPGAIDPQDQDSLSTILEKESREAGFKLYPVSLSEEEIKLYYDGFSNEIIWPLFHDLQSECHFDPRYWGAAQEVNRKFAQKIQSIYQPHDFLWIHDYHLMLVAQELRRLNIQEKVGFFLHIPFPPLDIFLKLPWRFQVLRALLDYDLMGFQTRRDQRNFIQCVKRLLPDVKITYQKHVHICQTATREVRVAAFPISIDYQEFSNMASGKEVEEQTEQKKQQMKGQKIIFSCDRLDITKGIPYRLEAIRHLLKTHPELHEKITFFQVVIPSRTEIPKYQNLKKEIDQLVGEINSEFSKTGWVPIQYLFRSISRQELIAFYSIAHIVLITPLKDGMNLVAKEYIASNVHENGILILSEFAGASTQLQHEAFLINPYDIEGLAETIYKTINLSPEESTTRMHKMRRSVKRYDVFWWVHAFLNVAISKELQDFPLIAEYTPTEENPK